MTILFMTSKGKGQPMGGLFGAQRAQKRVWGGRWLALLARQDGLPRCARNDGPMCVLWLAGLAGGRQMRRHGEARGGVAIHGFLLLRLGGLGEVWARQGGLPRCARHDGPMCVLWLAGLAGERQRR
ncbi:hypothetical protein, partial [Hydrogenophaga sp.]|uniref:hypothetical protein n=1 Tax=Hydrogenophaga sp. TaxID=1904254 RepID=UPI003F6D3A00